MADHPPHRHLVDGLAQQIVVQRGLESGQRRLVHPQGAGHGTALELGDQVGAAHDQARLGAAQQLVAAARDQRNAGSHTFLDRRLVCQTKRRCIQQCAAAQVVEEQQAPLAGQGHQVCQLWLVDKAAQAEVAAVDAHQRRCRLGDGRLIVAGVGAVGRAHLHQCGPALGHHIRDAEPTADLDQLSARDDHLSPAGKAGQDQKDSGGVVVDDQRCFGAAEPAEEFLGVAVARSPPPGLQIVFQIGIADRHSVHRPPGLGAKRCAAQVGVDDDAGGVDGWQQGGAHLGHQPLLDLPDQHLPWRARLALADRLPGVVQRLAGHADGQRVSPPCCERSHRLLLEQTVHAGQFAQFLLNSHKDSLENCVLSTNGKRINESEATFVYSFCIRWQRVPGAPSTSRLCFSSLVVCQGTC